MPKLRAALIKRGFRTADELPEDASAAAAMAPQPLQPQSLPESETEDEQPAAEATVLFGSKPCKQLRPQRSGENECAQLASTLGKAWEMGQPASRAEGELREITRANGVVWREQLEARQATVKRRREETAAHTEQCLCTREGAITMLKQSMKLNHQLNEQADELLKIAKIPISAPRASLPSLSDHSVGKAFACAVPARGLSSRGVVILQVATFSLGPGHLRVP